MKDVVIVSGVRTPIGKYLGALRDIPAYELASTVLKGALDKIRLNPSRVDEVILGQSYQSGEYVNIGRMALLAAGWPVEIPGITLDRRCCSGLDAICYGAMKIQCDQAEIVVAGGVESMSTAEFYIPGQYVKWGMGGKMDPKWGFMPNGHGALPMWGIPFYDRIQRARVMSQPIDRFGELSSMMSWAEASAKAEGITREEADKWSVRSHQKACEAMAAGKFKDEIVPVVIPQRKGDPLLIGADETPRSDTSVEKLARLSTVYPGGVCTAGNSSTENDGAAAVVLMSHEKAKQLGLEPLGRLVSWAVAAADPTLTYPAVPAAFAVQVLADAKLMGIPKEAYDEKINVNGSGISLGHPIAATGTMRMVTLLHEMKRRNARYGLETICGGGGLGICAIVEKP
jgi:acetyl-CoA C-acetyltransferase